MESDSFGRKVRERRDSEGWSQERLAEEVGISRNYLSQIERGEATNLSWQVMRKLATKLGISLNAIENEKDSGPLPPGLREFARKANLPDEDVVMLASIQYRGKQPQRASEWKILYKAIKIALEE